MSIRAASIVATLGILTTGCATDDAVAIEDAVLGVSVTSCEQSISNRATAVVVGDGLALTVAHTFDGSVDPLVRTVDGAEFEATVVYLDDGRDIALLSFEVPTAPPERLEIRDDADDPSDDARMVVLRDDAVVVERVGLLRRTEVTLDGEGARQGIEIEGSIDQGDSGAPLIGTDDRVIGMVFASSRVDETGWAVAGSELVDIANNAGDAIELSCP